MNEAYMRELGQIYGLDDDDINTLIGDAEAEELIRDAQHGQIYTSMWRSQRRRFLI